MKDKRRKSSETFIPAFDPSPSLPRVEELNEVVEKRIGSK